MDIITKTGEIWSENAIGAVISLIKESDDSIEAERKLTHWLTEMNCQLIAMALARIDTELYQIYKVQGWRVARRDSRTICCRYGELTYTRRLLQKEGKSFYPLQPEIIAIEGDGIILKNKKKGDVSEVHRLQVYEGVRKNGNRTELVGLRCFASTSRKELFAMAASYLHGHYDLSKTTVLSNGDGGSGYQFQDFEQMVEGCLDHQHFRDCYHVHEKIRTRLSFCKRELVDRIIRELHQSDDMMKRIPVWMDTARSYARTEADLEEVDKLQSYLERNAPYIPSLSQRGIHTEIHLGTAETNHRFYSYRMKRQGRSWSSEGMEYMVWVLTARKNKTLTQALLYHANGKSYKKMDRAMHKAVVQAERRMRNYRPGCLEGRIGVYGASSSPMGRLARAIQKY